MKKYGYKEFIKKEKLKKEHIEEIVFKEDSTFIKILSFLFDLILRIFHILFYLGLFALCSIGATYLAIKFGIFG